MKCFNQAIGSGQSARAILDAMNRAEKSDRDKPTWTAVSTRVITPTDGIQALQYRKRLESGRRKCLGELGFQLAPLRHDRTLILDQQVARTIRISWRLIGLDPQVVVRRIISWDFARLNGLVNELEGSGKYLHQRPAALRYHKLLFFLSATPGYDFHGRRFVAIPGIEDTKGRHLKLLQRLHRLLADWWIARGSSVHRGREAGWSQLSVSEIKKARQLRKQGFGYRRIANALPSQKDRNSDTGMAVVRRLFRVRQ